MEKRLIFFDTETTGLEPCDKICEIALSYLGNEKRITKTTLINPGISINPEAAMTTHISNKMVEGKASLNDTFISKVLKYQIKKDNIFVAYNTPFDIDMLSKDNIHVNEDNFIDLYRITQHLYKDYKIKNREQEDIPLPYFKLQYFRYLFELDERKYFKYLLKDYKIKKVGSHDALSDIIVLEVFFYFIMENFNLSIEEMLLLTKQPVLENGITFGNVFEAGKPYEEILRETYVQYGREKQGYDYLDWCVSNLKPRVDTEYSIKIHFFNALVAGDITYNKKFLKYINFGLVFEVDFEKIDIALRLINETIDYKTSITDRFIQSMNKRIVEGSALGEKFPPKFLSKFAEVRQKNYQKKMKELEIIKEEDTII